ncbi:hypothetical protein LV779_18740 [Streptomyces thinghirensis]|nr:hypothetical protein [Streptomyces thinghirensis]
MTEPVPLAPTSAPPRGPPRLHPTQRSAPSPGAGPRGSWPSGDSRTSPETWPPSLHSIAGSSG